MKKMAKDQADIQPNTFQRISKTRLSDQIMDQIKTMIADGMLQPGEQLPSERELASILNVSRLPLREALKALEATHVIRAEYGDGYFVCNLSTASLVQFFEDAREENNDEILQHMKEARKILETAAVELACERITDEDLQLMLEAIDEMGYVLKTDSPEEIVAASLNFHRQLIAASHNLMLVKMMDCISDTLYVGRIKTWDSKKENYYAAMTEHRKIVEAVKGHDAGLAKQLLESHLNPVY